MATRKSKARAKPAKLAADKQLVQAVTESAQKIWLAGLGAFARARTEGDKLFDLLVEQGKVIRSRSEKAADQTLGRADGFRRPCRRPEWWNVDRHTLVLSCPPQPHQGHGKLRGRNLDRRLRDGVRRGKDRRLRAHQQRGHHRTLARHPRLRRYPSDFTEGTTISNNRIVGSGLFGIVLEGDTQAMVKANNVERVAAQVAPIGLMTNYWFAPDIVVPTSDSTVVGFGQKTNVYDEGVNNTLVGVNNMQGSPPRPAIRDAMKRKMEMIKSIR